MSRLRISAAAVLVLAFVACGGKVVVDVGPGAGNGGTGVGGSSGVGGSGASTCFDPPDPSTLSFCGSSSSGDPSCIENDFCDPQKNTWSAVCSATTCECKLNG